MRKACGGREGAGWKRKREKDKNTDRNTDKQIGQQKDT